MKLLANIFTVLTVVLVAVVPAQAKGVKLKFEAAIYSDDKGGKLYLPEGADCSAKHLVVADSGNHRLVSYAINDKAISFKAEIPLPKAYPLMVHLDSGGDIFVLDGKERRIMHLGPGGEAKGYLDPTGLPAPDKMVPKSFVIAKEDTFYILDIFSSRVLKIGKDGKYLRRISFPENTGSITDLSLTPQGDVLILDAVAGAVYKAGPEATTFTLLAEHMKEYSNFPDRLTTDAQGTIYVVDQYGNGIIMLGPDGSFLGRHSGMGWQESLLRYPSSVCSDQGGELFVVDRNNNRIQVFSSLEN
ncbi:MAG: NHL repeat-containing protein [Proteobacteria bacterium]|nr:NHL repeat-containing protein [Pseudomonadota bacterium]MBU1641006.1 NHL repeat-containing protein [Pseudomonadota bacterium]